MMKSVYFSTYAVYLASILVVYYFYPLNPWLMTFWFLFQSAIEIIQLSLLPVDHEEGSWRDYFELWNMLDFARLSSQLSFIVFCHAGNL